MDFFEPGISLEDFEIGSVIQDGAMARIFQGTDRLSGETVALKVPFKDILNNPLPYYHHQTEDRVLRLLAHPYIVRSIRRPRTSLYLALEWVDGPDLKSLLWRHGRMAPDQVIIWAGQILEALIYMHALGVHHLDLKPENIMRASNGSIKLVDFGRPCGISAWP
jgi:serine/threonine protein kinase